MSSQLEELHEQTRRGYKRTEWGFMFHGYRMNAEAEGNGLIRVWFDETEDTEKEKTFDAYELGVDNLIEEVGEWVEEVQAGDA